MRYGTMRHETPMRAIIRIGGATLLALALLIGLKPPASAQADCGDRNELLGKLAEGHSKAPKAMGMQSNGSVIELVTSDEGSWTIIVTAPTGESCVVAYFNTGLTQLLRHQSQRQAPRATAESGFVP